MIDKKTGEIQIENIKLSSSLTMNEFILSALAQRVILQRKGEYPSFHIAPQRVGEIFFNLVLHFNPQGKLIRVLLSISPDGQPKSWDNWSEEMEQKIKAEHDKLLHKILGSPHRFGIHGEVIYQYQWGEVFSRYDPRSASSAVVISYT